MKIAIQVPLKARASQRVPGKNFAPLAGRPLFAWMVGALLGLRTPADVYIDSEDPLVFERVAAEFPGEPLSFHLRDPWFASDAANGNHLLAQFAHAYPAYDLYVQAFVTAPLLAAEMIDKALGTLRGITHTYDSLLLVTYRPGFFWYQGAPINQQLGRPDGTPRTQDAQVMQETTGLYAITRDALFATGCRIGRTPFFFPVDARSALDLDTPADFATAERYLQEATMIPTPKPAPLPVVTRPIPSPVATPSPIVTR